MDGCIHNVINLSPIEEIINIVNKGQKVPIELALCPKNQAYPLKTPEASLHSLSRTSAHPLLPLRRTPHPLQWNSTKCGCR